MKQTVCCLAHKWIPHDDKGPCHRWAGSGHQVFVRHGHGPYICAETMSAPSSGRKAPRFLAAVNSYDLKLALKNSSVMDSDETTGSRLPQTDTGSISVQLQHHPQLTYCTNRVQSTSLRTEDGIDVMHHITQ